VRIFDGVGCEWEAILSSVSKRGVVAQLGAATPVLPESPLSIRLAVAALKGDRMEWIIQKATELGVAQIVPVISARTDAAARPALKGTRQERWQKVASGAAEQSGRAQVPIIAATTTVQVLLETPFPGTRLMLLEPPAPESFRSMPAPANGTITLLIGPNGGWAEFEVEAARDCGFRPVGLGRRILRAETAAIVAVSAAQLLWGDLG
jgi:16S rRNA (uracil1498-N3)-methyltransferase